MPNLQAYLKVILQCRESDNKIGMKFQSNWKLLRARRNWIEYWIEACKHAIRARP